MRRHNISSLASTLEVKYSTPSALLGERRSARRVLRLLRSFSRLGAAPEATGAAAAAETASAAMQASMDKCRGMMLARPSVRLCKTRGRVYHSSPRRRAAAMQRAPATHCLRALYEREHTHIKLGCRDWTQSANPPLALQIASDKGASQDISKRGRHGTHVPEKSGHTKKIPGPGEATENHYPLCFGRPS